MISCPVLVAVLPYSHYTFFRALPNASLPHLLNALNALLSFLGRVPLNILSDNMKQWVKRPSRYEPEFNQLIQDWALHNRIGLLATRTATPKDKPSVEGAVLIAYRRVYALLRKETFRSLEELNRGIMEKVESLNGQNFQKKTFSRRKLFIEEEWPRFNPLPDTPYQLRHYTQGKVQKNYHVVLGEDWHYYSVPCRYIGKRVQLIYDTEQVEIYSELDRIALHPRNYKKHGYSTILDHMPENHRIVNEMRGWNPEHYLKMAQENGTHTHQFFLRILESKITIHQAYGPFLGIIRLISAYGGERVEWACKRALQGYKYNYGVIESILKKNMDQIEDTPEVSSPIPPHTHLRGPQAYAEVAYPSEASDNPWTHFLIDPDMNPLFEPFINPKP